MDRVAHLLELVLCYGHQVLSLSDACALLSTSTAAAVQTSHNCIGQFDAKVCPESLQDAVFFANWVSKHAKILRSIEYGPSKQQRHQPSTAAAGVAPRQTNMAMLAAERLLRQFGLEPNAAAGMVLARALKDAAAAGDLTHLHSFTCQQWETVVPLLRAALPTSITELQLSWAPSTNSWFGLEAGPSALLLAPLEGLQSLEIHVQGPAVQLPEDIFSPLQQLTYLELSGVKIYEAWWIRLPASLQRLSLEHFDSHRGFPLNCQHLTALTALRTGCIWGDFGADVLPVGLVELSDGVHRDNMLDGLTSLRHLDAELNTDQVLRVASAGRTNLTYLSLVHDCHDADYFPLVHNIESQFGSPDAGLWRALEAMGAAGVKDAIRHVTLFDSAERCAFGPLVPELLGSLQNLESLRMEHTSLTDAGVRQLCQLSGLTKLDLIFCFMPRPTLVELPSLLQSMPCLHDLTLPMNLEDVLGGAYLPFFEGLVQLTGLHSFWCWPFKAEADRAEIAAVLAAAPHLTVSPSEASVA